MSDSSTKPRWIQNLHTHLENIIWFWAASLAECLPTMLTPLVHGDEGRILHFQHLHRLLLDPIVVTTQELLESDFGANEVLRVVTSEDLSDSPATLVAHPTSNDLVTSNTKDNKVAVDDYPVDHHNEQASPEDEDAMRDSSLNGEQIDNGTATNGLPQVVVEGHPTSDFGNVVHEDTFVVDYDNTTSHLDAG